MPAAQQLAGIVTVPAAIGGVDFYSSVFGMPPENALRLTNWWPDVYGCTHRRGYREWVTLPALVGSVYTFHPQNGDSFLYCFTADGNMYDITNRDTLSPPTPRVPIIAGLVAHIWQASMFANSAGTHKVFVSGQDNPIWVHQPGGVITYDRLTAGDGTAPGTISGVNPVNFTDITIHQRRIWFVERGTCNGWYLPPDQVYGVATKFDFGPLFKRGGFLQSLATWTVGDGEGSNDLLVAFSSEGDIAVYMGIDPDSVETWELKGVFYAGALLEGRRFHTRVSGDLKFVTTQGIMSMNDMFTSNQTVGPQSNVEAQAVQQFVAEQASVYGFLHGWDLKFVPSINMLILNIPSVTQAGALQVCENTVNQRWTTFLGYDANCWAVDYLDTPFFCSGNRVCQGWFGHTDNVTVDDPKGKPITALVQQAYNFFGTPANNKQVGLYRPNFLTDRSVVWKSMIGYDFTIKVPVINVNPPQPKIPLWDTAIWDADIWAGGLHAQKSWASAEGMGFAGSLCMATRSDGEVIWANTDFTVRSGGIL